MAYRKSYYQQRTEERARIQEAIRKQHEAAKAAQAEPEAEPTVEEAPAAEQVEEVKPDDAWTKSKIQKWLDEHSIQYSRWMTKAKLLELVD